MREGGREGGGAEEKDQTIYIQYQELMSHPKGGKVCRTTCNGIRLRMVLTPFIWIFPQVGSLPVWLLCLRVKYAQQTAINAVNAHVVNITTRGPLIHHGTWSQEIRI